MKRIRKTHPPKKLLMWIKIQTDKELECNYSVLQGKPEHVVLKQKLLSEQGYICAYTGIKIDKDSSHIEHLKTQTKSISEDKEYETVDYYNMVACFPKNGGDDSYGYGAPLNEGKSWKEGEMISPCQEDCERRFSYGWEGKMSPVSENDNTAKATIARLGLDSEGLRKKRHSAIKAFFGFSRNPRIKELKLKEAEILLRVIGSKDSSGKYKEFCFVFEQLLPKYIRDFDNRKSSRFKKV
jgi:uncharacterized protein (TIGR02646 family)